jgi:uncharacterized protein (TIGR02147 family)
MESPRPTTYDHRYWLMERFLEGKRRNPRWSLRGFAGQLGVSASTLSEILSGKRPLTRKMSQRLSRRLGLSDDQAQLMERNALLAKLETALPDDGRINALKDRLFQKIDPETFAAISEWYYFAILCLLEIPAPKRDAAWIAKRLGLSKPETIRALRRLERLGLVDKPGRGGYRASGKALSIETEGYEPAIRNFMHQNLAKAGHALDNVPAELREICAITMAIDPKNLEKARKAVKRFRREMCDLLERGNKQRVYTLGVQLFPVEGVVASREDV